MDKAQRGASALSASNYPEAIKQYTAAISEHPESPDYYIQRSTAYQRSSPPQLDKALYDAEVAVLLARKRAKYELVTKAQLRRAIILFHKGQYANAELVLDIVKGRNQKESTLPVWEKKIKDKLKKLSEDDEAKKVTTKEVPEVELPSSEEAKAKKDSPMSEEKKTEIRPETTASSAPSKPATSQARPIIPTPPSQIKQDWYQSNDKVTLSILAKGVPKDQLTVDIQKHSLSISFPTATSSTYDYSLDPLFAEIDPSKSSYKVVTSKIEIVLQKATPSKWKSLEGDADTTPSAPEEDTKSSEAETVKKAVMSSGAPSYPTSSKHGPVNWDKVAQENYKDGEEEEQDPNFFFKRLYSMSDDNTKKAMMKSYQESNGTALSTNWEEVSKGPVETQPPSDMVAKKWGE